MERSQVKQLLSVLRGNYPQSYSNMSVQQMQDMLDLWSDMLADDDGMAIMMGAKNIMRTSTSPFAPTLGMIRNEMYKDIKINTLEIGEAWSTALKSCSCNKGIAEENFKKLPSVIQRAVGSASVLVEMGYANNDEIGYQRNAFEKRFKENASKDREDVIAGRLSISEVEQKNLLPNNSKGLQIESKHGFIEIGYNKM